MITITLLAREDENHELIEEYRVPKALVANLQALAEGESIDVGNGYTDSKYAVIAAWVENNRGYARFAFNYAGSTLCELPTTAEIEENMGNNMKADLLNASGKDTEIKWNRFTPYTR